jgi:hypothetical protein
MRGEKSAVHTKLQSKGLIDTDERIIVKWIMKKFELKMGVHLFRGKVHWSAPVNFVVTFEGICNLDNFLTS